MSAFFPDWKIDNIERIIEFNFRNLDWSLFHKVQVVYYSCQLCLVFLPDEVIHLAVMVKTDQNAGDRSSTSRPSVLGAKY